MNHCVPDWVMEDDLFPNSNEKNSAPAEENELVELLWRNGQVVRQSQTKQKPPPSPSIGEGRQAHRTESQFKPFVPLVNPSNVIQEDETAAWFQYTLDDSLEREFCSEFLCEMPITDNINASKPDKELVGEGPRKLKCWTIEEGNACSMPPPRSNFSHLSRMVKPDVGSLKSGSGMILGIGETSMVSSACGSNQVQKQVEASHSISNGGAGVVEKGAKHGSHLMISPGEGVRASTLDATMTSSSGGSGCSFGRMTGQQSTSNPNSHHKRKGRDGEESECHSEDTEYESVDAKRLAQPSTSTRKSRAAEVHNLSERRRRDRINEKMRALQELIPHCNKSDKASMLDEAIEYLKSLQLQLQLMWMGNGMAPTMFPGVQQYMSQVGIGMGPVSMPPINNPINLPRAPLVNHSVRPPPSASQMPMCPSPAMNLIGFPPQVQNVPLPEPYARYFGFPHMQMPPQAMNLYTYGSHMMQQNQTAAAAACSSLPTAAIPSKNHQIDHSGS